MQKDSVYTDKILDRKGAKAVRDERRNQKAWNGWF